MGLIKSQLWLPTNTSIILDLDENWQICPNFKLKELANNLAKDEIKFVVPDRFGWKFINMLQVDRDHFGETNLTSAYRTQSFNDSLPNATPDSLHCYMCAADIVLERGITFDDWIRWHERMCREFDEIGAIGLYNSDGPDRVHIEIRSDWRYGATKFAVRDWRV